MAWAPLAAAGIGAAGSIAGGLISQGGYRGAGGSLQNAQAGTNAFNQSVAQSGLDRATMSPWWQSGVGAANQIAKLLGLGSLQSNGDPYGTVSLNGSNWKGDQADAFSRFQTDPGYQFRLTQGVNALNNSAAARGSSLSGAQRKALTEYGQNYGSQEYGNYFNRLAGVSGQGMSAGNAANTASNQAMSQGIGLDYAGTVGQGEGQAGFGIGGSNALASGLVGTGNSIASGVMAYPWGNSGGNRMYGDLTEAQLNRIMSGGSVYA